MKADIVPTAQEAQPSLLGRAECLIASIPHWLPLMTLRVALAVPFYKSGLTKWDGFLQLSGGAEFLFTSEFRLHILGQQYPYPFPLAAAYGAGIAEILLPILLLLGLFTRFAAIGILAMTAVIQITVPEGWANFHLPWAAMALALASFGGGKFSLDFRLRRTKCMDR
ncbi:DoxX family protein [Mesorhizobium sp. VNQ89]|uniref:DoxX family protein n=1 Tax=Mesorhizobium quangtriensis TaxID=3157709 RepID=UPI0032B76A58